MSTTPSTTTHTPKVRPGCDVRALRIGPTEGYVLSRIDGTLTVEGLATLTGLSQGALKGALAKLVELGAIDIVVGQSSTLPPSSAPAWARPTPAPGSIAPAPAAAQAKLDDRIAQRINAWFDQLATLNHYEVLGVEPAADAAKIAAAFAARAKIFDPAAYAGKQLGPLLPKLEALHSRLRLAFDSVSDPAKRAQYDAAPRGGTTQRSLTPFRAGPGQTPFQIQGTAPRGHTPMSGPATTTAHPRTPEVDRMLAMAQQLEGKGEFRAAIEVYRQARMAAPGDREILAAERAAGASQAKEFLKDADKASEAQRWDDAGALYLKAATGLPNDAMVHVKAARALLRAEGNHVNKAIDAAKKAVSIDPAAVDTRLVLAKAYLAAGRKPAATGELDAAAKIAPDDKRIGEMRKAVREAK